MTSQQAAAPPSVQKIESRAAGLRRASFAIAVALACYAIGR